MTGISYEVRMPSVDELTLVQQLRHRVLDRAREIKDDLELSPTDLKLSTIHIAAFDAAKIVSTVRLSPLEADRTTYSVRKMATHNNYRRQGLGAAVLKTAEAEAIKYGACSFTLDARVEAMHFYAGLGYRATGEELDCVPSNFVMTKQVNNG